MTAPVPIPIWPWPQPPEVLDRVRDAYLKSGAPFGVQPVPANPGEPGRILGLGAFPPFLCDLAYVADVADQAAIDDRVRWLLRAPAGHKAGFLIENYLSSIFGEGVREVFDDAESAAPAY